MIEWRALMRALETDGPSETHVAHLKALYRDACVVIALGPSRAVPRDEDRPSGEIYLEASSDALPMAEDTGTWTTTCVASTAAPSPSSSPTPPWAK